MTGSTWAGLESAEVLETLAAVEHARWSHWQRYLHSRCVHNSDGSLTISADDAQQWSRQMATRYEELSEKEKESDREQALEYLEALRRLVASRDS